MNDRLMPERRPQIGKARRGGVITKKIERSEDMRRKIRLG